jgi:hypothetical protein
VGRLSLYHPYEPGEENLGRLGAAIGEEPVSVLDAPDQPCLLGRVGPVELPGDLHRALHQVPAWFVGRLEISDPGLEPVLIGFFVLMRQDHRGGREAVCDGVEPDLVLTLCLPWPGTLGRVPPVRFHLALRDHAVAPRGVVYIGTGASDRCDGSI